MDDSRKRELVRWAVDVIISAVIVPAILTWLGMSPPIVIMAAFVCLCLLKAWEWGYLVPATWTPDRKVEHGRLRACIAIALFCLLAVGVIFTRQISPDFISKLIAASPRGSFPKASPSAVPTANSENFPPNGVMISTEGKGVLRCDVPPTSAPTVEEFARQFEIFKNQNAGLGDTLGIDINVSAIRDGFRVDYEAKTEEGKDLLWRETGAPVSKFAFEFRRVGQSILVTFTVDRPWMPQWLMRLRPFGTKEQFVRFERGVEKMFGFPVNSCHVI